jgi:hypothetical protein
MPGLEDALDDLVEPGSRGDPGCTLRWTAKSTRNLAKLLATMGYSLQAARKSAEGNDHPDRDAQFRYLTGLVERFRAAGEPVISVDAKKRNSPVATLRQDGNGGRPGSWWRPTRTTSLIQNWARQFHTACTTWPETPGGFL